MGAVFVLEMQTISVDEWKAAWLEIGCPNVSVLWQAIPASVTTPGSRYFRYWIE
jgi:hypothetical protein